MLREVEFDSQHAPSNTTSVCRGVVSVRSPRTDLFGFSVSARSCRGLDSCGSSTPPQARQRGRRKTEARCELPELVDTQCLREYVSNLEVRTDVVKINFPGLNAFADEVIVHFNVFSPGMKHGVMYTHL